MANEYQFDEKKFNDAVETARAHYENRLTALHSAPQLANGEERLTLLSECISVAVENGQICLKLPIVGSVCIPIPTPFPDGTAAQACLSVCTTWGVPTGVCVTVTVAGIQVVHQCFGKC